MNQPDSETEKVDIDLGHNHTLRFVSWRPNRELNPQFSHLPDIERCGAIVSHINTATGDRCWSGIHFDSEMAKEVFPKDACWQVDSMEPLTLNPSLLCRVCGDHGFIRNGKWEPC